jgi:hypothetical protein
MQYQESGLYRSTRLFERAVILVVSVMAIVSMFYIVGNYQNFADSTQYQLLTIMQSAGSIATVGSVVALLLEILLFILHRTVRGVVHVLLLLVGLVLSFGITLGSSGLLVFLGPV